MEWIGGNKQDGLQYNYVTTTSNPLFRSAIRQVNASKDEQSIKVSQQIDDDNRVAPSIALRSGKMAVEWERNLGDDNSLTTTLRPNESVDMEWKDSAWTANINMPIDGNSISGANVSVKREVNF